MTHSFNVELAKRYGVESAIIIQHLFFWVFKNVANGTHFHDGRYWTYCSSAALAEIFPYMSAKVIWSRINDLIEQGFLLKGNYNKTPMDRTCWYAFTDSAICILRNEKMDFPKWENGFSETAEPIPYIRTDIYTDSIKEKSKKESTAKKFTKPTIPEIDARIKEMGYLVDAEAFYNYYESNGWKVGSNPMKDWRAALVTWNKKETNKKEAYGNKTNGYGAAPRSRERVNHDWSQDRSDF